ncbi:AraC family transcriptional regulator [Paenibacillus daejeonensis]|uniref:AraC family transcriptional regulator n=1 Tax=Paenibacillus daejeonensis TaxID=135193 RepID=UPI00036CF510|nr:AraC family transcriptional regulator [Paenibacillus daejeonensis]
MRISIAAEDEGMPKIEIPHIKTDRFRFLHPPELLFAGQLLDERHFHTPREAHQDYCEILYVSEGAGEFIIDDKLYPVRQGDIILYNAGVAHEERSSVESPLRIFYCGVSSLHIDGVPAGHLLPPSIDPVIPADKYAYKIESYLSEILEECNAQVLGYETLTQNLLMSLITLIYRIVDVKHSYHDFTGKSEITLRTKAFIDRNYTKSLTLKDIADTLYVSQHYLSHLFKKDLGDSPINYMITRRIDEAKRLLLQTDKPVYEIAAMVGYENDKYFSMLFKKVVSRTPGSYREHARKKGSQPES